MTYVELFDLCDEELQDAWNMWVSRRDQCYSALAEPQLLPSYKECLARLATECEDEVKAHNAVIQLKALGFNTWYKQ